MTWRVRHTRTFYKELARLPAKVRSRVEEVAFRQAQDRPLGRRSKRIPFSAEGCRSWKDIRSTIRCASVAIELASG